MADMDTLLRPTMSDRRTFLRGLTATAVVTALGGAAYVLADDAETERARQSKRADGRVRLPPNQVLLKRLRPMGGTEGDPSPSAFKLKVYGEVESPFEIDFASLLKLAQIELVCDVHCVTKWSVLDAKWTGVKVSDLANKAKLKRTARYVIFEAAAGYTSNIDLAEALKPNVIVAHKYEGQALVRPHGAPVRAIVPDRYFWKSAKWLTGIKFAPKDEPGYWEVRGYHNHADPWKEERFS
jgi:DMSO/TMAO reductase YedYZ molybdopterin-dependent catalytic subunit